MKRARTGTEPIYCCLLAGSGDSILATVISRLTAILNGYSRFCVERILPPFKSSCFITTLYVPPMAPTVVNVPVVPEAIKPTAASAL